MVRSRLVVAFIARVMFAIFAGISSRLYLQSRSVRSQFLQVFSECSAFSNPVLHMVNFLVSFRPCMFTCRV